MHRLPEIDAAYALRAGPPPSPVNAVDDPRATNQGYLNAAPQGIDARHAWDVAGGDGAGIGFVDLEQGWNLSHEDLAAAGITLISGANAAYFSHGTAVLGEVLQVDNTIGGVGIAPAGVGRVISQHQPGGYNTAAAIIGAVAEMAFGDVLLLEAQEYDPSAGGLYYWPVEVADANYDAIRLATALGIVVVEAGCNGGYDLDAYVNLGGQAIFQRGAAGFRGLRRDHGRRGRLHRSARPPRVLQPRLAHRRLRLGRGGRHHEHERGRHRRHRLHRQLRRHVVGIADHQRRRDDPAGHRRGEPRLPLLAP